MSHDIRVPRRLAALLVAGLLLALVPSASAQPKPEPEPGPTHSPDEADLYLKATGPARTPLVGERVEYSFAVGNNGPNVAEGGLLGVYQGDGLTFVSATSSDSTDKCVVNDYPYPGPYAQDGSGSSGSPGGTQPPDEGRDEAPIKASGQIECALGSMPVGSATTISMVFERTKARESYGSASIYSQNPDSLYENNYAELVLGPDDTKPADLALIKTAPRGSRSAKRSTTSSPRRTAGRLWQRTWS